MTEDISPIEPAPEDIARSILLDTEDPNIGETVEQFSQWIRRVFVSSQQKSYHDWLRHTHFQVPKRFIESINAPSFVEIDLEGKVTHNDAPVTII